jgi:electron transport complex protein RnfB
MCRVELLGRDPKPLNAAHGAVKPKMVAVVDEQRCIGCTHCIQACPVDAILGAQKQMHTVISQECIGCEFCIAPCPMDCIEMVVLKEDSTTGSGLIHARQRHKFRLQRLEREKAERAARYEQKKAALAKALQQ